MIYRATAYEALLIAIRKNSYKVVQKILSKPNSLIIDNKWIDYILLIKALQRGRKRIAKLLLKSGCHVNTTVKTNFYHTPLYYAVRLKDRQLIKLLLQRGACINGRDFNDDTAFCLALRKKYHKITDIILSHYLLQIRDTDCISTDDYVALYAACLRNNKKIVGCFIKKGISLNKCLSLKLEAESHCTPLHVAIRRCNIEVINLLLESGADFNVKNKAGQTPLHLAYCLLETRYPLKDCWKIIDAILSKMERTDLNPVDDSGLSHFHISCTRDQPDVVKHLIQCKVDVNSAVSLDSTSYAGYTALHFAIENRQKKIVKLLLENKADTTVQNRAGNTPLHFAFYHFSVDDSLIDLMLTKYVPKNVNSFNKTGISHFHIACATDNVNAIDAFVRNGVSIDTVVKLDSLKCPGFTPLHLAVSFNRRKAVKALLQHGADLSIKEKKGFTPLHLACQQDAKKIHTILRNSVQIPNPCEKVNFERAYREDPTIFLESISKQTEQQEVVELLLNYKSNIDAQDDTGKTALFYACDIDHETFECEFGNIMTQPLHSILNEFYKKRKKIVETLLQHKPDVNVVDKLGNTALHYITDIEKTFGDEKKAEIAKMLLDHGADINAKAQNGSTPFHIALKKGYIDLVEVFLKYDVDPNIAEKENLSTALHLATLNDLLAPKSEEIISALLNKGADVNAKEIDGITPLHIAASTRYSTNKLKLLLEMDCDIDCLDLKGRTPLHQACINRNADNVQNLLNNGADMNILDRYCRTAFFYFYEFQIDVLDSRRRMYEFHPIFNVFNKHITKLKMINYYVSWENLSYYMKLKELQRQSSNSVMKQCEDEIRIMKDTKITNYSTLYDILFKDPNKMAMFVKNEKLKEILESKDFKSMFPQYECFLKLQYKKGLIRYELLKPSKEALTFVLGLSLPDACSETILKYLTNKQLQDLVKAQVV